MLGIVTIALGEKRYIDMAKMLALSLIQIDPQIKRAVITDADKTEFDGLYDIYVPHDIALGKGLINKLYLDHYSPFEETLFIDADCLAFKPLDDTIALCQNHSFVVFGDQINSGEWYMDVAEICKKFNLQSIPLFNGGVYYFKKNEVTTNIYNKARELYENYTGLNFVKIRESINEEPLIAVAMAINNIEAIDDEGAAMRTPIGINGALTLDILNKKCYFNKAGVNVEPAILHFAGSFADGFHYKRETAKLSVANKYPMLNKKLISVIINLIYNVPYGLLVFFKRIVKFITRGEQFNFTDRLPVFSNH